MIQTQRSKFLLEIIFSCFVEIKKSFNCRFRGRRHCRTFHVSESVGLKNLSSGHFTAFLLTELKMSGHFTECRLTELKMSGHFTECRLTELKMSGHFSESVPRHFLD